MALSFQVQGRQFSFRWVTIWLVAELLLFVLLAERFGFLVALLIEIVPMVVGVSLLRRHGRSIMQTLAQPVPDAAQGMGASALNIAGAVLLIVPGLLTSIAALALSVPGLRQFLAAKFAALLPVMPQPGMYKSDRSSANNTVDLDPAEWTHTQDPPPADIKRLR